MFTNISKSRILFVIPGNSGSKNLKAVHHYAIQAAYKGFNVAILGEVPSNPELQPLYFIDKYASSSRNFFGRIIERLNIYQAALYEFKPDIVHIINHLGVFLLPIVTSYNCKMHPKMILDIRTMATSRWQHKIFRTLKPINRFGFDHVFALNKTIINYYLPNNKRTSLLPLGYDQNYFHPEGNNLKFSSGERLSCIYYGTMDRVRGLEVLINGLIKALEKGVDLEANLVGEGNDKERLKHLVPKAYKKRIRFHRFFDQQYLAKFIKKHHLGLAYIPVKHVFDANLPLKTVEMIASGLPVLATDTQGNKEVIRDKTAGFVVKDDPLAICEGIISASRGEGPMCVSPVNRATTVQAYTWPELASNYLFPIYEDLLKK